MPFSVHPPFLSVTQLKLKQLGGGEGVPLVRVGGRRTALYLGLDTRWNLVKYLELHFMLNEEPKIIIPEGGIAKLDTKLIYNLNGEGSYSDGS